MIPEQCHLWQEEIITNEDLNASFERIKIYEEDSHLIRALLRCKFCNQLYFYEFIEEIDWKKGNDPQFRTYIPIENEEQAKEMSMLSRIELLNFCPRLHEDWPSDLLNPVINWDLR